MSTDNQFHISRVRSFGCQEGTSDKVYHLVHLTSSVKRVVVALYGPRTGPMVAVLKDNKLSMGGASRVEEDLAPFIRERYKKSYSSITDITLTGPLLDKVVACLRNSGFSSPSLINKTSPAPAATPAVPVIPIVQRPSSTMAFL